MTIVLVAGFLPAIALLYYVYTQDRIEREPISLLLRLVAAGGLTTIAASLLESIGVGILGLVMPDETAMLTQFVENFIVVALVEEGVKHYALRRATWFHPEFNYRFDGIVYSVAVSLGFAAVENVMYILNFGMAVAPIRAITAIPLHCICGIFMGHFYGEARHSVEMGKVGRMKFDLWMSMLAPVALHGFYDFCQSYGGIGDTVAFLLFLIVLYTLAFLRVRKDARKDTRV